MRHVKKFVEYFYETKDTVLERDEWLRLKRAVMDDFDDELLSVKESQALPGFNESMRVKARWQEVLKQIDRGIVHFDTGVGRRTFILRPPKENAHSIK